MNESKVNSSRRAFLTGTAALAGAYGLRPLQAAERPTDFRAHPIGRVETDGSSARIRILDEYADGLLGLDGWSHVNVLWWLDQSDTPEKRRILRVHPRGNRENPLTGVFACRAPFRPNPIALTVCRILSVEKNVIRVDAIDAFDGTPVLDLKPHIPPDSTRDKLRVPDWAGPRRPPASGREPSTEAASDTRP